MSILFLVPDIHGLQTGGNVFNRRIVEARPGATVVLLVHYLHCVDLHASGSEAAADERRTLDTVDAAIAPSQFVRRALIDEGMPANRASVVRPGLHEHYRDQLPAHLRQGPPRILPVANLLPAKGEVLRDLRELPWTWTLVGDASLDPDCAEAVFRRLSTAGLSGRVVWTGPVSPGALRVAYDRADLFVLPSRFETCSLSTREAMSGRPG